MRLSTRLTLAMVGLVLFTATAAGLVLYGNLDVAAAPRSIATAVTLASLLAVVMSLLLSRSLSRSLVEMSAAIAAFGRGEQLGTPVSAGEVGQIAKDARRLDMAVDGSPIRSPSGRLFGSSIMARDLSAEKLSQDMFRLAVESCPSGMMMFDRSDRIVLINASMERLFGYSREELIDKPVNTLVPNGLGSGAATAAANDLIGLRKDGSRFPIEVNQKLIPIRDGLLILGVVVDVSERRQNERRKDEFVSTVSHELRTPLTSIAASLGLLAGGAAGRMPEPTMRLLQIAHKNSERLVRLINDILDIEKIESGKVVFDLKRVEAGALIAQAIEANRGYAEGFGVNVAFLSADAPANVRADPDRLVQVITNLLSNAIKFSPRGGEVVVALAQQPHSWRFMVRDHGAGIPEEFKPRIFEKFAQADATDARQKGGTGLGLSIVKQIVTLLGGAVGFDTPEDGGTVFYVDLPRWELSAEPEGTASSATKILDDDELRQPQTQTTPHAPVQPTRNVA